MFDLTKPVYVKKQILDMTTQCMFPIDMDRYYRAEAIPEKFRNDEYLTNDNGRKQSFAFPEVVVPPAEAVIIDTSASASTPTKKANASAPVAS